MLATASKKIWKDFSKTGRNQKFFCVKLQVSDSEYLLAGFSMDTSATCNGDSITATHGPAAHNTTGTLLHVALVTTTTASVTRRDGSTGMARLA